MSFLNVHEEILKSGFEFLHGSSAGVLISRKIQNQYCKMFCTKGNKALESKHGNTSNAQNYLAPNPYTKFLVLPSSLIRGSMSQPRLCSGAGDSDIPG